MSRTIRRKYSHGRYWWYKQAEEDLALGRDTWTYLVYRLKITPEAAVTKARYQYHSDRDAGWNAPADFRHDIEREFRSKNKRILKSMWRDEYFETPDFIPFRKNVNWLYF